MKSYNINFHNVSELCLDKETGAYYLLRLPASLEKYMSEQGKNMNRSSIGVELRFKMLTDVIEITLYGKNEAGKCYVYFGSVQGEWFQSSFIIEKNKETIVKIKRPLNEDVISKMNEEKESVYPSDMVRLVFDGTQIEFKSITGSVAPYEIPKKTYLAYGSSITSNSITYIPNISYVNLLARYLKMDLINVGSPGSCEIQKEIAEYICNYNYDIATIELGINIIDHVSVQEYKKRCEYFLDEMIKNNKSAIFYITDVFSYFNTRCNVQDDKLSAYRETLRNICFKYKKTNKVYYIPGDKLLKNTCNICADLVHPDIDGHLEIYSNLVEFIAKNEKKDK